MDLLKTTDTKIKKVSETQNTGVFSFSPLPQGFGRTLGSALRRVLLASIPGAAVTQLKFPKAIHQFSTLPGVKEDLLELSLNFKRLVVKNYSKDIVGATISKKGPGAVTVADIKASSDLQFVNKELHLAHLADSTTEFEVDLIIENGVGYSAADDRKTNKIGVLMLDALFSPVLRVSYEVLPARKEKLMDLDELVLTVQTNGVLTPDEAVAEAATQLRNFFSRFAKGVDPEELVQEPIAKSMTVPSKSEVLIEDLPLPTRTLNALKKQGITNLKQLAGLTDEQLADIKNLGEKSLNEVKKLLIEEGLR